MEKNLLKNTLLRTIQYKLEDGIVELVMSGMFLLAGIYFYLQAVMANSQLADMLTSSFVLLSVGGWFLMQYAVRVLRERITFPRTGYVAYRKGQGNRTVNIMGAIMLAVLTAGLLLFSLVQVKLPQEWNMMPVFLGLLMAVVFGLMGFQAALPRFFVLALISLILGLAFAPTALSNNLATSAYCGAMSVVLLISGSVTLRHYLRQNPAQPETHDDN